jgi:photosystem II stability/assembly factor-like uncharacterized protein
MKTKLTLLFIFSYFVAFSQWQPTNGLFAGAIQSVVVSSGEIIVGTKYIYKSSDNGKTWFMSNNGITGTVTAIHGLVKSSGNLVAVSDAGAFYSTDNGNNWTQSSGTASLSIWCVVTGGSDTLFMSTDANGVYKSINKGVTWNAANTNINTAQPIYALAVKGHDIYAGSDGYGIYKSTDHGSSWNTVNTGLPGSYYGIGAMAVHGNHIYAGTYGAGMYYSSDNGAHWLALNNGISASDDILGMGVNGNSVYASTLTGTLYKTTDSTNWSSVAIPTYITARYQAFYSGSGVFYVGAWGAQGTEKSYGLFRTKDDGATWQQIGITDYPVSAIEVSGSNIIAGTADASGNSFRVSLFQTTEADTTWSYNFGGFNGKDISALKASGAVMYLFDNEVPGSNLVYRSTNNGNNWTSTGYNVLYNDFVNFVVAGSLVYAGDNSAYYTSSHVFVSSDNGQNFTAVNSGFGSAHSVYALVLKGTLLFVGTDNGVYMDTVGHNNWAAVSTGLTNMYVKSLCVSGSDIYAGTQGGGIFKSSNNGGHWNDVSTGIPLFANITCFAVTGNNIFAGTDNGVYNTSNGGTLWERVNSGLIDTSITALAISPNYLWAGTTSKGVWRRQLSQVLTSTGKTLEEPSFKISPNPATTSITIEIRNCNNTDNHIFIYNSVGDLVLQKNTTDAVININVSSLSKGIYFVKIYNSDKIQTEKIIVQ